MGQKILGEKRPDYLNISMVSPHVAVGTQTLARWIKTMMNRAGVIKLSIV